MKNCQYMFKELDTFTLETIQGGKLTWGGIIGS
ncbi:bacteriocin [Streptococcus cuniculipharyngis]|uniref:Bacteriocin n=1 Tax=Streptococcus cuniculipharyngis TaxID=1562651 RepID=A0A5C5SFX2_9STRE|nr:bacteriocin [Streptococcus cuniculipharyngis]